MVSKLIKQFVGPLILIWAAVSLITLQTEQSVFRIVEYYISTWTFASVFSRVIAAALFILAGFLALGRLTGRLRFLILVLLIPIADNVLYIIGYNKFGTLFLLSGSTIELVLQVHVMFLFMLYFLINPTPWIRVHNPWLTTMVVGVGIGLTFIRPVDLNNWSEPNNNNSQWSRLELQNFLKERGVEVGEEPFTIAFFTASDIYSVIAAVRMGINQRNQKLPKTVAVFRGGQNESEDFSRKYNLENVEFVLVDRETFFQYAGRPVPSIFYASPDGQVDQWKGTQFGYRALDYISH